MTEIYYLIQAYKTKEDPKYNTHIYPSYLTSYDLTLGGDGFGLQTGFHDALKFEKMETAKEWLDYAATKFPDRSWDIVPMDSRLLGRKEPLYIVEKSINYAFHCSSSKDVNSSEDEYGFSDYWEEN